MSSLTEPDQIMVAIYRAEAQIDGILRSLESETGLCVRDVNVSTVNVTRIEDTGTRTLIDRVSIRVEAP